MSQLPDNRGLLATCASEKAMVMFEKAIHQLQSHTGDPFQSADAAIREEPNFVMAHCLRAYSGTTMAEAIDSEKLRRLFRSARSAANNHANPREQLHMAAIESWLNGDLPHMAKLLNEILIEFPLDFLALQRSHLIDFHMGAAAQMRNRVEAVLPHYESGLPDLGYVLGMHAFSLEENHQYDQAQQVGLHALEINSDDVWAIHAVAHVMEMQMLPNQGIDWYTQLEKNWAIANNFSIHNWWHVALFHLSLGNFQDVLDIYDKYIATGSMELDCVDGSSLLWRLYLNDVDVGIRWQLLADKWESLIQTRDFYCFNDYHALLAFLAAEHWENAKLIADRVNRYAQKATFLGCLANEVGKPIVDGLTDFARQRYDSAVKHLSVARDCAYRSGGSHVQRDVLTLTLMEAVQRSGRKKNA